MGIKRGADDDPIRIKGKLVMYTKNMIEYFPAIYKDEVGDIIVGETKLAIYTVNRAILRAFYERIENSYDNWLDKCSYHYDRGGIGTYANIVPYGDRKNKNEYRAIERRGSSKDVNNPMHEDFHLHHPSEYPIRVGNTFLM